MMRKLRVAYVTQYDAKDISTWSGLGYYISRALEPHVRSIGFIGNLEFRNPLMSYFKRLYYSKVTGSNYLVDRSAEVGRQLAREVAHRLSAGSYDVVICPSTMPIAYLDTRLPLIAWIDATFAAMLNYYFFDVCAESVDDGNLMEQNCLEKARLVAYASDWAAASAIRDYGAMPATVRVIPFGANMEGAPQREDIQKRLSVPVKLLFVGRDWERKGGEIAFETLVALQRSGVPAELSVVGCVPPEHIKNRNMFVYPKLDKRNPSDVAMLSELYLNAHFLLLPSRAECYGLALCEANAFGVPVLATDTGGIPTIVKDGVNGFLMSREANGETYCSKIVDIIGNACYYSDLSNSARARYESDLNWDVAGRRFLNAMEEVV